MVVAVAGLLAATCFTLHRNVSRRMGLRRRVVVAGLLAATCFTLHRNVSRSTDVGPVAAPPPRRPSSGVPFDSRPALGSAPSSGVPFDGRPALLHGLLDELHARARTTPSCRHRTLDAQFDHSVTWVARHGLGNTLRGGYANGAVMALLSGRELRVDERVSTHICAFLDCRLVRERPWLAPCIRSPFACPEPGLGLGATNGTRVMAVRTVPIHNCARRGRVGLGGAKPNADCATTRHRLHDRRVAVIVSDEDRFSAWWLWDLDHRQCLGSILGCDAGALGDRDLG